MSKQAEINHALDTLHSETERLVGMLALIEKQVTMTPAQREELRRIQRDLAQACAELNVKCLLHGDADA